MAAHILEANERKSQLSYTFTKTFHGCNPQLQEEVHGNLGQLTLKRRRSEGGAIARLKSNPHPFS